MGMLGKAIAKPFAIVGCSFAFDATITFFGLALSLNEREQAAARWVTIVVFLPSLCCVPYLIYTLWRALSHMLMQQSPTHYTQS